MNEHSGKKPEYLGVQKNPPSLALCPATENCISTSENISDLIHYAPPWYALQISSLFMWIYNFSLRYNN